MILDCKKLTEYNSVSDQYEIGAAPEMFLEKVLNKLQYKETIKYMHLHHADVGDVEDRVPFDFKKFGEVLAAHLPKVELLYIMHMPVKNFVLKSEAIKSLQLLQPEFMDNKWDINLPYLENLDLQFHSPPGVTLCMFNGLFSRL